MEDNIGNILAENGELIIDSLIENEILKQIPILGTSLNIYRGINSIRDAAYVNKVKIFIDRLGEFSNEKRQRLVEESKKDEKSRAKMGDALFTTIEQSDSRIKIEYLAIAFEAFLNEDFDQSDFRLICHIIQSSFSDELEDVIESTNPKTELKYLVPIGLAEAVYKESTFDMKTTEPNYELSESAKQLRHAWRKYGEN